MLPHSSAAVKPLWYHREMNLGDRGSVLIKSYEDLRLEAYQHRGDVPTIGWGHTRGVELGMTCTVEQAEAWFREDVAEAEAAVNSAGLRLTPSMFDSLVSLVFNVGPKPATSSSAIGRGLRAGDYFAAWRVFAEWINQDGEPMLGLARRRAQEMALFLADGLP